MRVREKISRYALSHGEGQMKGSGLKRRMPNTARLALALVLASLVLPPQTVWAAKYDGYCDSNEVCVYRDANLGTPRSDLPYYYADMDGAPSFHTYNYPPECNNWAFVGCRLNDSISSIDSWSDHRSVRFFTDTHYDGAFQTVPIYGRVMQVQHNDSISSECWNDGGVPYSVDHDCTFPN